MYHGTSRTPSYGLTVEGAANLAQNLQQTNEFFAIRLADNVFPRFVLRILLLKEDLKKYVTSAVKEDGNPDVMPIVNALCQKLTSPAVARLLYSAARKQGSINKLSMDVTRRMNKKKIERGTAEYEEALFREVLRSKSMKHKKEEGWRLSSGGLMEAASDFHLLHDFYFGKHTSKLERLVSTYGSLFLTPEERKTCDEILEAESEKKQKCIQGYAEKRIRMLWYFSVCICRILQTDDHWLNPFDAYWLGLVNEVNGTTLPNERILFESEPPSPPKTV